MLAVDQHQLLSDWRQQITMNNELFIQISIQLAELLYKKHDQQGVQGNLHTRQISIQVNSVHVSWNFHMERQPKSYMAPEQFGIINRGLDVRSDLYSLGIILYELLFSTLPFDLVHYEDWAHVHLYASPLRLADKTNQPFYPIIEKLLAKSPDDRYQTSYGVLYDLRLAGDLLKQGQTDQLHMLQFGMADQKQFLHLDEEFVVRKEMLDNLYALKHTAEKDKRSSIVLLHSGSGFGKTVLLRQYQQRLQQDSYDAWFVTAGGESLEPYGFVKQLKQLLLQRLLQYEPAILEAYVVELKQQLGAGLSLWLQLFPQASCLWPSKPAALKHAEYEKGVEGVLSTGLKVLIALLNSRTLLTDASTPIDHESLSLLSEALALRTDFECNIVIAVPSEIASLYHAALERARGQSEQVKIHQLELQPLGYEELTLWIGHALSEHSMRIKRLCWAIYFWTKGIPSQIRELLEQWVSSGILFYDYSKHQWVWQQQSISYVQESDQSLSLHIDKLKHLQPSTIELLSYGSVIGMQFSRSQLLRIREMDRKEADGRLADAIRNGIIAMSDEGDETERNEDEVQYIFLLKEFHDALYIRLSSAERANSHLKLGFLHETTHAELARSHWNKAVPAMDEAMKQLVTELNYEQAIQAFHNNRFRKASEDFELALMIAAPQLLADPQEVQEESTQHQLHMLLMLSISLRYIQQVDRSVSYFNKVEQHASELEDRDCLYVSRAKMEYYSFTDNQTALSIGKETLGRYGLKLGTTINIATALKEVILTLQSVRKACKQTGRLQLSDDPSYLAQCELMVSLIFPYLIDDPVAYLVHFSRFIREGIKQGVNQSFICIFASYEVMLQRGLPGLYKFWPKDMLFHLQNIVWDDSAQTAVLTQFSYSLLQQLEDPFEAERNVLKVIEISGIQGDNNLLNLASMTLMVISQGCLPHLEQFFEKADGIGRYQLVSSTMHYKSLTQHYYDAWKNKDDLHRFIQLEANGEAKVIDNFIAIQRAEQAYLAKCPDAGMKWIKVARTNELSVDWIRNRRMRMYEALLAAELYRDGPDSMKARYRRIVLRRATRMHKWAGAYGANSAAHYIIRAEACRLDNKYYRALLYYERAVKQAKQEDNELLKAIALEQLAYTYQEKGQNTGFYISLLDAVSSYKAWGATVKVDSLLESFPSLAQVNKLELTVAEQVANVEQHAKDDNHIHLKEANSVRLEAVQQEAAAIEISELSWTSLDTSVADKNLNDGLHELMRTIKLRTGADQAVLLLMSTAFPAVLAHSEGHGKQVQHTDIVNMALIHFVSRVNETIIVNDATQSVYATDSYIRGNRVKALLCMPILLPDRQKAIIVLENRAISHIFSQKSIETVEMLSTRFAYLQLLQQPMKKEHEAEVDDRSKALQSTSDVHSVMADKLTARELEILQLIADGFSNKEIGDQLYVSEATVKSHVYKIYQKLQVKRRAQAVSVAREINLIP